MLAMPASAVFNSASAPCPFRDVLLRFVEAGKGKGPREQRDESHGPRPAQASLHHCRPRSRTKDPLKANFSGDEAMTGALTKGVALAVLLASLPAWAQKTTYAGNTMGVGSGKCATYRMDMEVVIDGTAVKGRIKQQGRPDRSFNATLAAGGKLETRVVVGGDGSMDVIGTINDKEARVLLDGYCKFDFRLTPK
jgi:hypothetical protein